MRTLETCEIVMYIREKDTWIRARLEVIRTDTEQCRG